MKSFHVADLNAQGEVRATQAYDYATLERVPGCSGLIAACSAELYRQPQGFEVALLNTANAVTLRWVATASTAGIATVRVGGRLASVSILASGLSADADAITLNAFQQRLTSELHDTGYEPGFGLLELPDRPLVATVAFHEPVEQDAQLVVALADRCFAASYFRFHHLA